MLLGIGAAQYLYPPQGLGGGGCVPAPFANNFYFFIKRLTAKTFYFFYKTANSKQATN